MTCMHSTNTPWCPQCLAEAHQRLTRCAAAASVGIEHDMDTREVLAAVGEMDTLDVPTAQVYPTLRDIAGEVEMATALLYCPEMCGDCSECDAMAKDRETLEAAAKILEDL